MRKPCLALSALAALVAVAVAGDPPHYVRRDSWHETLLASLEALAREPLRDGEVTRTLDLGGGVTMELVRIPAGEFVMGDPAGAPDEQPCAAVTIAAPFWMARCEVTNAQFARFDPAHESRFEHRTSWIFSEEYLGWRLDRPHQPVVRVSWQEAMAFCAWLSERSGARVTLPTEAQWEYACRAGAATAMAYGGTDADFAALANMGDASLRGLAYEGWRPRSPDLVPRDDRVDDGALVTADVGSYRPNAWGLFDMHGNAGEWTRSTYRPYPYRDDAADETPPADARKVVRGGSWRERPERCRAGFRLAFPAYRKVYNTGFRVILQEGRGGAAAGPVAPFH